MDPVSLSMLNLRVAQFIAAGRKPTEIDKERLSRAAAFLDRILSAMAFFADGEIEALDETAYVEARKTCQTLQRLSQLSSIPAIHKHIAEMRSSLQQLIDQEPPARQKRERMKTFFSVVSRGLADDAVGSDPVLIHLEDESDGGYAVV